MSLAERKLEDRLSYYIKPDGTITAVMPDQEPTFTLGFIRGFVGPVVELVCYTHDGYALVCNPAASKQDLPVNEAATSLAKESCGEESLIRGRAFLIHPEHFDRRVVPAA
jgi:hypothetical protein